MKSILRFMIFYLYYIFMPFMMKTPVQHTMDTFLTLTNRLPYQTHHFEIVSFSTLERSLFISFTTGIFTGVGYLRINKLDLP